MGAILPSLLGYSFKLLIYIIYYVNLESPKLFTFYDPLNSFTFPEKQGKEKSKSLLEFKHNCYKKILVDFFVRVFNLYCVNCLT